jgi:hypothetical protein
VPKIATNVVQNNNSNNAVYVHVSFDGKEEEQHHHHDQEIEVLLKRILPLKKSLEDASYF